MRGGKGIHPSAYPPEEARCYVLPAHLRAIREGREVGTIPPSHPPRQSGRPVSSFNDRGR